LVSWYSAATPAALAQIVLPVESEMKWQDLARRNIEYVIQVLEAFLLKIWPKP
jgi:hypothetical protein